MAKTAHRILAFIDSPCLLVEKIDFAKGYMKSACVVVAWPSARLIRPENAVVYRDRVILNPSEPLARENTLLQAHRTLTINLLALAVCAELLECIAKTTRRAGHGEGSRIRG